MSRHELRNSVFAIEVGVAHLANTDDRVERARIAAALQAEVDRVRAAVADLTRGVDSHEAGH